MTRLRAETHYGVQALHRVGEVAGVAKLEYARDLGSRSRETVRVRVPPSAPTNKKQCQMSKLARSDEPKVNQVQIKP